MHRKGHTGGTLPAAALILCLFANEAAAEPACPIAAAEETVVTGATLNGGLLTAEGQEVILAGLAFPQAVDPAAGTDADPRLATAIARLATGPVRIAAGIPDRYGRVRANVYVGDGRWLQEELVAAGLAIVRPDGGGDACVRALLESESVARRTGSGLWADSNIVLKASEQASLSAKNGIYGLVEGRVVSVGYGSRMVFLDFGRNFRTDFTVMVQKTLVPRLLEAGIAVESLAGRAVRVRGVMEDSGGPAIRIADPFALELLDREE